jgi:branched-chain amino acid transport system ATP-binding protein
MGALLTVDNIVVKYGNITALKRVSVEVPEGAVVCLIGANGAGKSTLLKAIVGLEPLASGTISFDGRVIGSARAQDTESSQADRRALRSVRSERLTTDRIVSLGISLVPEGRRVFADMTVEENLEMGAFRERETAVVAKKIDEMYSLFPILKERRRQKTRSLSGGEQQMMAIARALMSSPRLLLLDEPGLGLAPLIIKHIFSIIKRINKEENVTVFLVEQNAKIALNTSDKGYVMETGNIVLEDQSSHLLENDRVKAAYLGE